MLNSNNMKIGLIGLGNMGTGLLRVFLKSNFQIIACTKNTMVLEVLAKRYSSYVSNGMLTLTNNIQQLSGAHLVIEVISEDVESKKALFTSISSIVSAECIICSNTSSLSISQLSGYVQDPTRFVGLHFFNPPTLLNVVEIVKHAETSQATIEFISEFITLMNFQSIIIQDSAGFLVNRLLFGLIVQAIKYYEENIKISPEAIDSMMTTACNFKMGPLKTADLIGLDTCLTILKNLKERIEGDAYCPPKLLEDYVSMGFLGKKSGRGFYEYA